MRGERVSLVEAAAFSIGLFHKLRGQGMLCMSERTMAGAFREGVSMVEIQRERSCAHVNLLLTSLSPGCFGQVNMVLLS